jgi:prolyl 4-hydroxylase
MKQKFFLIGLLVFFTILILLGCYFWKYDETYISKFANDFNFDLCSIDEPYEEHRIIKDLITKNEAQELIDWARPKLKEATVLTYSGKDLSHRDNSVAWLDKSHPISKKIFIKTSAITGLPMRNFEKVQICHYKPGQLFNHHQDQCHDKTDTCLKDFKRGGQRLYNVLMYLNNDFQGGETDFNVLKKRYKLPPGSGILWAMTNKKGNRVHPKANHAGLPVTHGEKWIANIWQRKNKFI